MNFIGNQQTVSFFKKIFETNRISSTYLFSGPEGVGKKFFAILLAKSLVCQNNIFGGCDNCRFCNQADKGIHPDIWLYTPKNLIITIDQIRLLIERLKFYPTESKYSIHIIDNVETMKIEAANAMLKIIEEPPPYAILFLITSAPLKLPQTVLSRCQKINFQKIRTYEIYDYLIKYKKMPLEQAKLISSLANGNLSKAVNLNLNEYLSIRENTLKLFHCIFSNDKSITFPEFLPPAFTKETEYIKDNFKMISALLSEFCQECLLIKAIRKNFIHTDLVDQLKKIAEKASIDDLFRLVNLIEETKEEYEIYHQNPILLLQRIVLSTRINAK